MNAILNQQWTEVLGLTLLDSLWQGALVLGIAIFLLALLKKASPSKRYIIVLCALLVMPIISGITFSQHWARTETSDILSQASSSSDFYALDFNQLPFGGAIATQPVEKSSHLFSNWKLWAAQNANIALAIWCIGALLFTIRMLGGFYFLKRIKSRAIEVDDSQWFDKLEQFCQQLNIKRKVLLKESVRVSSPIVLGVFKPMIIFPLGLIQSMPTDQIEAILVHELAHIKRKDFLINIVINVLQVVYFFHPAYWWLSAQLDAEREYHCDDIAIKSLGQQLTLVKALSGVSQFQQSSYMPALAFAGKKNQLLNRVKRIVDHKPQVNWLSGLISLSILMLSFFLMSNSDMLPKNQKANATEENETSDTLLEPITPLAERVSFNEKIPQDTGKVADAILEILQANSPIQVEAKGGNVISIKRNGESLEGDELKIYTQAYLKISDFSREKVEVQEITEVVEALNEQMVEKRKEVEVTETQKARLMVEKEKLTQELIVTEHLQAITEKLRVEIEQIKSGLDLGTINFQDSLKSISLSKLQSLDLQVSKIKLLQQEIAQMKGLESNLSETDKARAIIELVEKIKRDSLQGKPYTNIRFEYDDKILTREEIGEFIPIGLAVDEVVRNYSYTDSLTNKKTIVDLVKLKQRGADENASYNLRMNSEESRMEAVERFKQTMDEAQDKEIIYEMDGQRVSKEIISQIDPNSIASLTVFKGIDPTSSYNKKGKMSLIRIYTKKGFSPSQSFKEFQIIVRSPDYKEVVFGIIMSQKEQLDLALANLSDLQDLTPLIELNGELKKDWNFQNLYQLDGLKLDRIVIITGDKMYDYYKKSQLRKREVLLKVTTK